MRPGRFVFHKIVQRTGQTWRRSVAPQQTAQAHPQAFHRQIAFNVAADSHADRARFFRDNHRHRIGFLGDADARAMPRSQLRREHRIHRERKKTGGGRNAVPLHNHRAVVQRRARPENRRQQIVGKPRIHSHAAFDVRAQADLPLNHDQRARLILRKKIRRQHDVVINIGRRI